MSLRRPATVRPIPANPQAVSLHHDLKVFAPHTGKLDLNDQAVVGRINVGIGHPMGPGGTFTDRPRGAGHEMHRGTNFAHGCSANNVISPITLAQALHLILISTSGRFPLRARNTIEDGGVEASVAEQPQWPA